MRVFITQLELVDGLAVPVGLPEAVGWAAWPIEDRHPEEGFHVLILADTDLAPTAGRDMGDPLSAQWFNDPLPRGATNQIADHLGYDRNGGIRGRTRQEVFEFMTADTQLIAVDRFWSKRISRAKLLGVAWLWEHVDEAWFLHLTSTQRQFIRALSPTQKAELRAASLDNDWAERRALLTGWAG